MPPFYLLSSCSQGLTSFFGAFVPVAVDGEVEVLVAPVVGVVAVAVGVVGIPYKRFNLQSTIFPIISESLN